LKEIKTELEIMASSKHVWQVLTDFPNYSRWNPVIVQVKGEAKITTKLEIHLRTKGGKNRIYKPTITKVEPNHELRWFGKSIFPGMLNGERIFTIDSLGINNVLFFHRQIFTGLGVYIAGNRLDRDIRGTLNEMNVALKKQAEQLSVS
jgi:hypothetical protein